MNDVERLFLLNELNQIEKQLKKKEASEKIPFIEIFNLYKQGLSYKNIARKIKLPAFVVHEIIHGAVTIPRSKIKKIRSLGFKICSCCEKRIVPIKPLGPVFLTRLCKRCYKEGEEIEYSISSELDIKM